MNRQEEARIDSLVEAATAGEGTSSRAEAGGSEDPATRAVRRVAAAVPTPRDGAEAASLDAFLAHAQALRTAETQAGPAPGGVAPAARTRARGGRGRPILRLERPAWLAVAAMAAVAFGMGALLPQALPGDAAYPLKRAWEDGQLAAVEPYDVICTILEQRMAAERREEVRALLERRRPEAVAFSGLVTALGEGTLEVEGIPVRLDAEAEIALEPAVGHPIEVRGRTTEHGDVLAERLGVPPDES